MSSMHCGVRPRAVELVQEDEARNLVFVGLAPDGLALRLHPVQAIEDDHGAIEDAERALHLGGEIHVPRRVDELEAVAPRGSSWPRR